MINDRPIEDANLQAGLDEVREIMRRRGLAGACMLVSAGEAAFTYAMHAPWSAIRPDPHVPLGFRIRANSARDGAKATHQLLEGAAHTICQLSDFGEQTTAWMEDLKLALRRAGVEFDHTPFGGRPLPHLSPVSGSGA